MNINKKLQETEKAYNVKIENLKNLTGMINKLQAECINFEGQLQILRELANSNEDSSVKTEEEK